MHNSILVYIHFGTNTGYAIGPLEKAFFAMAQSVTEDDNKIHFAYKNIDKGPPRQLPDSFKNVIAFDPLNNNRETFDFIDDYIKSNKITIVFGFDLPVSCPAYSVWYSAGVKTIISYWGAPMSSKNTGIKLAIKRLFVALTRNKPTHFIFESFAMQTLAVYGRGISKKITSVVPTGVDPEKFKPSNFPDYYAHSVFEIPKERKIIIYSGHMEERKGVHIIVNAAVDLIVNRNQKDVHFLILGNRPGEEKRFDSLYKDTLAHEYITFGGYRNDVPALLPSCYAATIASTGWDSFPMSALEMASCGLPVIGSDLQGIHEMIIHGQTGILFEPGNVSALAGAIENLLNYPELQEKMGAKARQNIMEHFTVERQIENLKNVVKNVVKNNEDPSANNGMK